jgi:hypothetical protein
MTRRISCVRMEQEDASISCVAWMVEGQIGVFELLSTDVFVLLDGVGGWDERKLYEIR